MRHSPRWRTCRPIFVSIHALLAECDAPDILAALNRRAVSIHALLAECAKNRNWMMWSKIRFNPRTPCGVRLKTIAGLHRKYPFQSTHSLRSATGKCRGSVTLSRKVSIHALLAECDMFTRKSLPELTEFQSTHSLRSATRLRYNAWNLRPVSIHALLAECDRMTNTKNFVKTGFNPRTPCGVRLQTGALEDGL